MIFVDKSIFLILALLLSAKYRISDDLIVRPTGVSISARSALLPTPISEYIEAFYFLLKNKHYIDIFF
jgi:hypothetical protein